MPFQTTTVSEFGRLTRVLLKHPREAFRSHDAIAAEWKVLGFVAPPSLSKAIEEYDAFADILRASGVQVETLPAEEHTNLDSIYVRDASIVSPRGVILCRMGKRLRAAEPAAQRAVYRSLGIPVVGELTEAACVEGGDVVWLDDHTIAVGHGYRTNEEGILQLRGILGDVIDDLIVVPLPHWRGPGDVLHLMSLISPVADDLAVVYPPLAPVALMETLAERGIRVVPVDAGEYETMGCNVLAIAPRRVLMLNGNPRTRAALESAGCEVHGYDGSEISLKGDGGPTCLTAPVWRSAGG